MKTGRAKLKSWRGKLTQHISRGAVLFAVGCGGTEVAPKAVDAPEVTEEDDNHDHLHGMRATAEIGALNEEDVDKTFSSALPHLQECLNDGAERVEFIGGSVAFFVKIDRGGVLSHAHLEESTLGDRATEKCMLDALRMKKWPKPVGGDTGIAKKSFDFETSPDVRSPTDWSSERVRGTLGGLRGRIDDCKQGTSGKYRATVYIATDGSVLAASAYPPDETGEAHVDCIVDALSSAHFESPGSWPAKVQFKL